MSKPHEFYKLFRPFLSDDTKAKDKSAIKIKVNGKIEKD